MAVKEAHSTLFLWRVWSFKQLMRHFAAIYTGEVRTCCTAGFLLSTWSGTWPDGSCYSFSASCARHVCTRMCRCVTSMQCSAWCGRMYQCLCTTLVLCTQSYSGAAAGGAWQLGPRLPTAHMLAALRMGRLVSPLSPVLGLVQQVSKTQEQSARCACL